MRKTADKNTLERREVRERFATPEALRAYYRAKYPACDDPRHPGCAKCGKGMPEEQRKQAGKVVKT